MLIGRHISVIVSVAISLVAAHYEKNNVISANNYHISICYLFEFSICYVKKTYLANVFPSPSLRVCCISQKPPQESIFFFSRILAFSFSSPFPEVKLQNACKKPGR